MAAVLIRRIGGAAAAAAIIVGSASPVLAAVAPGAVTPTKAEGVSALVSSFGKCAQTERSADVILLLDRSASLLTSDPDEVRRTASASFVTDLADFAKQADIDLKLQVAGFNGRYMTGKQPWLTLPGSLAAGLDQVNSIGSNSDLGTATDYWMALDGARQQLGDVDSPCQAVIWFTDGMYDLDENGEYGIELPYAPGVEVNAANKQEIIAAGVSSLCSPNAEHKKPVGPVNGLRANDVYMATVGLKPQDPQEAQKAADLLARVTTGKDNCGREPRGDHAALVPADRAGQLGSGLAALSGGDSEGTRWKGRQAVKTFGLDETVNQVTLFADADSATADAAIKVGLRGPLDKSPVWFDEAEFAAGSGTKSVSGGRVKVKFTKVDSHAMNFSMNRVATGWTGKWSVVFRADRRMPEDSLANTVLKVYGDLEAVWTNADDFKAVSEGQSVPMSIRVRHSDGKVLTGRHPGVAVTVEFKGAGGDVVPLLPAPVRLAELDRPVDVTMPATTGAGKVVLTLDVTIKPDTRLQPKVTAHGVKVSPPPEYPDVAQAGLIFPEAGGLEPVTTQVPAVGPGCVWLDTARVGDELKSLPDEFAGVTLASEHSSEASCLKLQSGEMGSLALTLTPVTGNPRGGHGSVVGALHVWGKPLSQPGAPKDYALQFSADRWKLVDSVIKYGTLVLGLLLGLGIPAALLLAVRAGFAKIPISSPEQGELAYLVKRIRVSPGLVVDADSGGQIVVTRDQVHVASQAASPTVSSLDVEGVSIRARALGNPFVVPEAVVSRASGPVVSDLSASVSKKGTARLPLALQSHWVAWHLGHDEFAVVMFVPFMQASDKDLPELSQRFQESLDASSAVLVELGRSSGHGTAEMAMVGGVGATSGVVPGAAAGAFGAAGLDLAQPPADMWVESPASAWGAGYDQPEATGQWSPQPWSPQEQGPFGDSGAPESSGPGPAAGQPVAPPPDDPPPADPPPAADGNWGGGWGSSGW